MPKHRLPPTLIPLLKHISSGNYFSGEELAAHFSLSRATIFNLLKVAQDHGLRVNAVRGKGYRLARPISWLDADLLETSIHQLALDYTLLFSDTAESTNSWLMDEAISGAPHRTIAYADYQFAGRGRRGRVWQSPLGGG